LNSKNNRRLQFRYIRIPNGRYSGRIGQIKSSNKKGDHTVRIVALPGEVSGQTTVGNNYIVQHRNDILKLSAEEREAIRKLEAHPRKKRAQISKEIDGAKDKECVGGPATSEITEDEDKAQYTRATHNNDRLFHLFFFTCSLFLMHLSFVSFFPPINLTFISLLIFLHINSFYFW
jgi:hypothetical protein